MNSKTWKLKDIIMMAILGVIFAVVYLAIFYVGVAISGALTPFGLGVFGYEIIYGIWFMAATLAMYIIRKPGIAFVTEILAAVIEMLLGNTGGVLVVITGIIQGAAGEAAFAIFKYKKFNIFVMALGGIIPALATFVEEYILYDYAQVSPKILIAQIIIRMISGIVFTGIISKLAGDGLARTGVLKSYALGAKQPNAKIMED